MSKKISAKDNLPEDNVDSPFPIRRSNRISLSQNSSTPNSKPVKSITTRRSSASSLETQNGNVEAGSPFVEKRRTRRTSTDSDTKPTPIRTRRSSASKILEEEKKLQTAPNTPTRRSTRAVSTSPSKSTDIPARRTRRSVSREVEISEELPLPVRRSSRRSSVDAQENATNEQALEKPKKNTRRLRSASIDELEEKAKKPLEPIEELENISEETKNEEKKGLNLSTIEEFGDSDSEKSNTSQDKTKESKRIRKRLSGDDQLVSIKLKENGMDESEASDCENTTEDNRILEINAEGTKDMDKSEKILKELDEVLESKISSPKKKSAIPDNTRSIFSPITPRKFDAPEQKLLDKEEENKEQNLDKSRDETFGKSDGETLGRVTKQSSDNKEEKNTSPLKRKRGSLEGQDSATSKEESVKSVEETESIKEKKRAVDVKDKMHISMGSDDSFTLHMNMTLDKTQFPQGEDDDNVFSSPGSNKENSSINVSLNKISDKKELEIANKGISVFTASVPARKSFYEPMEVDEDDLPSSIVKDTKTATPTKTKRFSLNNASPKIGRDVQNQKDTNKPLLGSNNGSNKEHSISSETEEIKKGSNELVEEGKFTHINSFQSDKEKNDCSFDSPKSPVLSALNNSKTNNDSSSEISFKLVDTDDENVNVEEGLKEEKTTSITEIKRSKRRRISDGTSSRIHKHLRDNVEIVENPESDEEKETSLRKSICRPSLEKNEDEENTDLSLNSSRFLKINDDMKDELKQNQDESSEGKSVQEEKSKQIQNESSEEKSVREAKSKQIQNESSEEESLQDDDIENNEMENAERQRRKSVSDKSFNEENKLGKPEKLEEKSVETSRKRSNSHNDENVAKIGENEDCNSEKKSPERRSTGRTSNTRVSLNEVSTEDSCNEEYKINKNYMVDKRNTKSFAVSERKSNASFSEENGPTIVDEENNSGEEKRESLVSSKRKSNSMPVQKVSTDDEDKDEKICIEEEEIAQQNEEEEGKKGSLASSKRKSNNRSSISREKVSAEVEDEEISIEEKEAGKQNEEGQNRESLASSNRKSNSRSSISKEKVSSEDEEISIEEKEAAKQNKGECQKRESLASSKRKSNSQSSVSKEEVSIEDEYGEIGIEEKEVPKTENENGEEQKRPEKSKRNINTRVSMNKEKTPTTDFEDEEANFDDKAIQKQNEKVDERKRESLESSKRKSKSRLSLNEDKMSFENKDEETSNEEKKQNEQSKERKRESLVSKRKSNSRVSLNNSITSTEISKDEEKKLSKKSANKESVEDEDEETDTGEERVSEQNSLDDERRIESRKTSPNKSAEWTMNSGRKSKSRNSLNESRKNTEENENLTSSEEKSKRKSNLPKSAETSFRDQGKSEKKLKTPESQGKEKLRRSSNIGKEGNSIESSVKDSISPLKSKMDKMKECGIDFSNPTPSKSKVKLDADINAKLTNFLSKKLEDLVSEESSEDEKSTDKTGEKNDESMSEDYQQNEFLDDMAEEGEEDTPSEGSNDIVDEGESIHSTDSEYGSSDSYDYEDSFLVADEEQELLSGNEYDLDMEDKKPKKAKSGKKRSRIIPKESSSSDEEVLPRVSFSEKVTIIDKKATKLPEQIPSIQVDLVNSSEEEPEEIQPQEVQPQEVVQEKSAFEEKLRSLVESKHSSTPNNSFSETANSSRRNTSARSSSIIVHENVSVSEVQESILAEKLNQVVKVFCSGIKSPGGNISMSVSLDYIEDSTKPPVSLGTDNDVIFIEDVKNQSVVEDKISRKSLNNSVPMMDKSSRRGSGVQGDRRSLSSISPQMKDKRLSQETNKPKVSPRKTKSCNEMDESETSPKKKKSSSKTDDLISLSMRYNGDGSGYEAEEENKSNSEEHKYSFKDSKDTKKKRKSSKINTQSAENEGSEEAEIYEPVSEAEVEDEIINQKVNISLNSSKKRRSSNLQKRSSRSEEKRENENSDMDEDVESSNSTEKYIKEETEVVEKMNKGKHVEANSNKNISKSRVNKRMKMLEMCEKLTVDDLRHKIPSRSEINSSNKIIKRKELKRLQSKLRASSKNSLLSGLVTDVKNRPRRLLKPSIDVNNPGWVVEEDGVTPSSANLTCVFNVKKLNKKELKSQGSLKPSSSMSTNNTNLQKFDAKDFKNQMLYDARVRREPTSNLLRKKGYYYY